MDKDLYMRILDYRTAMAVIAKLLNDGVISAKEYDKIDTIMTKKYGVNSSTIFG